jgi:sugar/nucleoside kinase (ribokinase family)
MLATVDKPLVVGLGQATVAFSAVVPRFPEAGSQVELGSVSIQPGGAAAIATATVSALGCGARFCTRVADDFLASFINDALSEDNIDLRLIRDSEHQLSAFSFTALTSTNHVGFASNGDIADLDVASIDIDSLLHGASALIVDGALPRAQSAVAEEARQRDILVIFNGGTDLREGTGELVALADVLICSERLAAEIAPHGELKDSLVELQRLGPRVAILTLGAAGSIGLHGDQLVEQPSFPIQPVDANGAGDVYTGAFAVAMLNSLPFSRCMEFASASASLSCTKVGAWAGIPTRDEVLDLVRGDQAGE